jgi:glutamyl-tRNA synthetase
MSASAPASTSSAPVVTRFAPSPTGYLHVGGARTALFNWLLARHTGGKFLLRIEDTDLARSTTQAVDALLDDLKWLGLHWDNAELVYQSKRLEIYNALIEKLIADDKAYHAYETPDELDAMRKQAERAKRPFIFRRPKYTAEQLQKFKSENRTSVVRFVMPVKEYRFRDVALEKDVVFNAPECQDFVIRKSDGMPTYHFGVVVDDAEMGITHILRGQEHLLNTFNHIALQEALGYARPTYAHLSVILNTDKTKMGKRDRDKKVRAQTHNYLRNTKKPLAELAAAAKLDEARLKEWLDNDAKQLDPSEHALLMPIIGLKKGDLPEILVHDFRENGYLPEALLNFLALLGWSPGGDKERMTIDELTQLFSIERLISSNASFNRDKLQAFQTEAANSSPPERLVAGLRDYLSVNPDSPLNRATDEQLARVIAMNAGFRVFRDIDEKSAFLFVDDAAVQYDAAAVDKTLLKNDRQGLNALKDVRDVLAGQADWSAATLENAVKAYCDGKQLGLGKVAQPIRVAVSGTTVSPPIFDVLIFLGRDRTLARLDRCVAQAG